MQIAGRSQSVSTEDALSKQNHSHCVSTAAKSLLADLRSAAKAADLVFDEQDRAAAAFGTAFTDWLSAFTYTRVDLAEPSVEFPMIWLIARHHPRLDARRSSTPLVAVAFNAETHRYLPISASVAGEAVPDLAKDPAKLNEFLETAAADVNDPLRINYAPNVLQAAIPKIHTRLMRAADAVLAEVMEDAQLHGVKLAALRTNARKLMSSYLKSRQSALNADLTRTINGSILDWAKRLSPNRFLTPPLELYNHVLAAPSPTAVSHRMSALDLLSQSGNPHLADATLWSRVDQGHPPQDFLAPLLGVRPSTMRMALHRWGLYSWGYVSSQLPWLDALDPNHWPKCDGDRHAFQTGIRMAQAYGRTFGRNPQQVLRDWKKQSGRASWSDIIDEKLARRTGQRQQPALMPSPDSASLEMRFVTDVKGAEDMRNDINRRLIFSAVRIEAERLGANPYQYADAAQRVGRELAARLWAEAGPSEQLQISRRWHAAQQARPASASPTTSPLTSWLTLIDRPLNLACGIVVHQLETAAQLTEEGAVMRHCVGSMAMQCRLGTKHIFSLRSATGKRLSTLSLDANLRAGDGSRLVVLGQNLAVGNKAPPARAVEAATEFIARINASCSTSGVSPVAVDWSAIDASRQPLCAGVVDREEFGFAIHNADEQAATRHLIWPYLPHRLQRRARSIAGVAGVTFADLATAAGVHEVMKTWWATAGNC